MALPEGPIALHALTEGHLSKWHIRAIVAGCVSIIPHDEGIRRYHIGSVPGNVCSSFAFAR